MRVKMFTHGGGSLFVDTRQDGQVGLPKDPQVEEEATRLEPS
jgi:hypothetical protein